MVFSKQPQWFLLAEHASQVYRQTNHDVSFLNLETNLFSQKIAWIPYMYFIKNHCVYFNLEYFCYTMQVNIKKSPAILIKDRTYIFSLDIQSKFCAPIHPVTLTFYAPCFPEYNSSEGKFV